MPGFISLPKIARTEVDTRPRIATGGRGRVAAKGRILKPGFRGTMMLSGMMRDRLLFFI
jgi:hypothetical protein